MSTKIYHPQSEQQAIMESLYKTYSSTLYAIILRIVSSEEVAQQLLQHTFLKVWADLDQVQTSKSIPLTLIKMARDTALENIGSSDYKQTILKNNISKDQKILDLVLLHGCTPEDIEKVSGLSVLEIKRELRKSIFELRQRKV